MERMFDREPSSPWRRIERRSPTGGILDYVEVGACSDCGRGVDKETPTEYRLIGGELYCAPCVDPDDWAQPAAPSASGANPPTLGSATECSNLSRVRAGALPNPRWRRS